MIEYDYGYKHLISKIDNRNIMIEIGRDNYNKTITYTAKSNFLFYDTDECSFGHACGVGENENEAMTMCLNEIKKYTGKILDFKEIDCPQKITFEKHKTVLTLYFKIENNDIQILTSDGIKTIKIGENVLKTIINFCKKYNGKELDLGNKLYKDNQFEPIFENTFQKFLAEKQK